MALDESAVSDLLDALRVGEGTDLVRELAQWALQQLIDAEATERVGAEPCQGIFRSFIALNQPFDIAFNGSEKQKIELLAFV